MATKLDRVQVVIIDEISMVSGLQLQTVDKRLRDIFNEQLPFGGRSVIAVGNFMQLPCVAGAPVYSTDPTKTSNKHRRIFGQNLWSLFKVHHLTQIMRQNNVQFQTALNNVAKGKTTTEDKNLFDERTFCDVLEEARVKRPVRLFPTNAQVDSWNDQELDKMTGEDYTAEASDVAIGDGTRHAKIRATNNVRTLRSRDTMSLRNSLRLKVCARYMVTLNIDTPDGLVNGAVGTLMRVDHGVSSSGATKPLRLWVKFNHDIVRLNTRQQKRSLMQALNIDPTWTPINPIAKTVQRRGFLAVSRKQFP
ncbi:hypothetical protein FOCC_FOCC012733 [Frankliniella occidentalis]|uniref:ATP-dependent DNA helicase n=1 Tax=Frankliniella occidentalis TaxID=133901 RepID=A0A6J1SN97_FRAOC|nr:uncharacterized protein LOC113209202 [Frankliniella occidentalis]KAE8741738.1 hypothetical protein FOCC_FOCC012733 [Frankliniella occidentalis]